MIREVEDAAPATRAAFDEIIDVRSPAEFAEDHVPGAINLPVLTNEQRAEVGTLYIQKSKFVAKRLGAAYVSGNISLHLAGPLSDRPAAYQPLVYCWRGGQRSNAMATVLSQVGWRVGLLRGGYKTYRGQVVQALYGSGTPLRMVLLDGPTGAGKTDMLDLLAQRGAQILDLEGLAAHRGSLFGDIAGKPQPMQKMFESRLVAALDALDPTRPIVVEAESSRIGDLKLPPRLWRAMCEAPGVELQAPLELRARRIAATYGDMLDQPEALVALIDRLPRHHSREQRGLWADMARAGDALALARELIEAHYDPSYRRSSAEHERRSLGAVEVYAPADAAVAADTVARLVDGHAKERSPP
jgi:tRNA 2-selenouridine synthase